MEPWLTNYMRLVICHQIFLQICLIVKAEMPLFLYSESEPCCFIFGEISIFIGPIVCCIHNGFTKVCIKSTMNLTIRILSLVSILIKCCYVKSSVFLIWIFVVGILMPSSFLIGNPTREIHRYQWFYKLFDYKLGMAFLFSNF